MTTMKTNQKILIGMGILGALVVAFGLFYIIAWSLNPIVPTDTKIIKILEENKESLLSIDGVGGAGIARNESNNYIIGITVYVEDIANIQEMPSKIGEFKVFIKKISQATEFEKERMLIHKQITSLTPSSTPFFPTQKEPATSHMLALLSDKPEELIVDGNDCLHAGGYLLVWPYGFSLTDIDDITTVVDNTGKPIARAGDKIEVGGGECAGCTGEDIAKISAQLPNDRCSGPYWIVGEIIQITK